MLSFLVQENKISVIVNNVLIIVIIIFSLFKCMNFYMCYKNMENLMVFKIIVCDYFKLFYEINIFFVQAFVLILD